MKQGGRSSYETAWRHARWIVIAVLIGLAITGVAMGVTLQALRHGAPGFVARNFGQILSSVALLATAAFAYFAGWREGRGLPPPRRGVATRVTR